MSETKPNDTKPSEVKPRKVVGRNVAIALGIVSILLAVGLGGAMAYYTMTINNKNSAYDSYVSNHSHTDSDYIALNSTYYNYVGNHTHSDSEYDDIQNRNNQLQAWLNGNITNYETQISQLNSNITSLQNQVNDLTSTVNLAKSDVWVDSQTVSQPASSYHSWTHSTAYAGYLIINVLSSTTSNTYVEAIYNVHGVYYDNKIPVNSVGWGVFPILPSNVEMRVGNSNLVNGATETVTITYHY